MKIETINKLQIGLILLATIVLITMNVCTLSVVTFNVLRVILAISWIGYGILPWITRKLNTQ